MLKIRPLKQAELEELLAISLADYRNSIFDCEECNHYETAQQYALNEVLPLLPNGVNTKGQYIYSAIYEGKIAGYLWYSIKPNSKEATLLYIYICPQYRNRGFGKKLLQLYHKSLFEKGIEKSKLYVFKKHTSTIGLYRACGYKDISENTFYDATKPTRIEMIKNLIF